MGERGRADAIAPGLLAACAAVQLGLGFYFIVARPPLLPDDLRFLGLAPPDVVATAPRLPQWLDLVFTVMGGQMAAVGLLAAALALRAWHGRSTAGDLAYVVLAGAASAGVMSGVNFALDSDFRWWLLGPVVVWAAAAIALWRARSSWS